MSSRMLLTIYYTAMVMIFCGCDHSPESNMTDLTGGSMSDSMGGSMGGATDDSMGGLMGGSMGGATDDSMGGATDDSMGNVDFISSPHLLVGRGADQFIPVEEGEVSTLHRGCQGAQHLWVSLRLPTHSPDAYQLELTLIGDDGDLLAPPFTLEEEEWLGYSVEGQSLPGSEIIGLTLVIFDPMAVVGREALVKTRVQVGDRVLESRVRVEVQWGADAC